MFCSKLILLILIPGLFCTSFCYAQAAPATEEPPVAPSAPSPAVSESSPHVLAGNIRTIYIVPMRNGMDRYLARDLTHWGRFEVILNPQGADVLMTDTPGLNVKELIRVKPPLPYTTQHRPGTMFLIQINSEKILWATSKKPTSKNPLVGEKDIEGLAQEIVDQLKHDVEDSVKKKQKQSKSS